MRGYGRFERALARMLDPFPLIRSTAKHIYQIGNSIVFKPAQVVWLKNSVECRPLSEKEEHFFGYYDKSCWSPDGSFVLYHRVSAEGPTVDVVVSRIADNERTTIGHTPTWNWQQGAMSQWFDLSSVIFNTIYEGLLVSEIREVATGVVIRRYVMPVQCLSPDRRFALSLNYLRLARLRPDYGYSCCVANLRRDMKDEEDGLWLLDLASGESRLVVSIAALRKTTSRKAMAKAVHKVNHAVISPDSRRVAFMHRWIGPNGKCSRLFTMNLDGSDRIMLLDSGMISHYAWRDSATLVAWAREKEDGDHYYIIHDGTGRHERLSTGQLDQYGDGHPSYSPDRRWLITDSYPRRDRCQALLLYDTMTDKACVVGLFYAPWKYSGTARCDLHPRWSPDGRSVSVDSTHSGRRALYLIDLGGLIDA